MSVTTQIRRSLVSLAVLAAFGLIASAQGRASAPGSLPAALDTVAACPNDTVVEPVAAPAPRAVEVRIDWRARLPATIARSRS